MRKFRLIILSLVLCTSVFAQERNFWTQVDESTLRKDLFALSNSTRPSAYKIFSLNDAAFKTGMSQAPHENNVSARNSFFIVSFPNADGQLEQFRIVEAPSMHPALAARFPGITAYAGVGITDPSATIRFDVSPLGTHITIMSDKPTVYIDKLVDNYYRIAARPALTSRPEAFNCLTDDVANDVTTPAGSPTGREGSADDATLRKYRLALLAGAEFSQFYLDGTETTNTQRKAKVLIAQNAHVTRTNALYERDLGIRLELVAENDRIIYLDPASDPVDNQNGPSQGPLQSAIDAFIGSANYDIGHTESRSTSNNGSNGNAGCIACVCVPGAKGLAFTSYFNLSMLDLYVIDFLTHEIGHQFGANHTFTHEPEGGGGNYSASQLEPGSGSTIMGYAGITAFNVQLHSDDYFHARSILQITNYIKTGGGSTCSSNTPTGNVAPTVNAGNNFTIPISTPFALTGSATDPTVGDVLSYCWEQMNTNPNGPTPSASSNSGVNFRTYLPTASPVRVFPRLSSILDGTNGFTWERLPSVNRTLNFRLTVRDQHVGGGGNAFDDAVITVTNTSGPFLIQTQNTAGGTWDVGSTQTVSWSVNNTTAAPVSCANVNILLSLDNGETFPITLAANTPNDGTENIVVPNSPATQCRVKVEAVGNIFFDINNAPFAIPVPPIGFEFDNPAAATVSCAGANFADITLNTTSTGGFSTPIVLSATTSLPAGTSITFTPTPVNPGSGTVVRLTGLSALVPGNYDITIQGTAGSTIRTRILRWTVQAGAGPTINTQPQSQAVCATTQASFSVAAAGTGITYLWQQSTDGTNWSNATGTNNASTYTVTATIANDQLRYRVNVIGQCGTTVSNVVQLTTQRQPEISAHPQNDTKCEGGTGIFNVSASGTGISYLWQVSTDGGTNYNTAPGANTAGTYNVSGITTAMNGNRYRVVVTGTCAPAVTSNPGQLIVRVPPVVTTHPQPEVICATGNVTFTVAGTVTPAADLKYEWQVSTDGGNNYTNLTDAAGSVSGTTTASLALTDVSTGMNNNRYRARLYTDVCGTRVPSNAALLTVNARPTVTVTPSPGTDILPGQSITLAASQATGFDYTWFVNNTPIPGATGTTYVVDSVQVGDYKARIVDPITGCNNESNVVEIRAAASERLFVYPSPNTGRFTVSYYNSNGGGPVRQTISIYDAHGALVYNRAITVQGNYTLTPVDLSHVSTGIYIILIGDSQGKKLAKEKIFIYH